MPKYVPVRTTATRGYNAPYQMSQSAMKKGYDIPYESLNYASKQRNSNIAYPTPKITSTKGYKIPVSAPRPAPKAEALSEPRKPVPKHDHPNATPEKPSANARKERRPRNYILRIKHERSKHRQLLTRVLNAGQKYGVPHAGYDSALWSEPRSRF